MDARSTSRPWLAAIAAGLLLLTPGSPANAQEAPAADRPGARYLLRLVVDTQSQTTDGSSQSSSHDEWRLQERIVAATPEGVEVEYDHPPGATAQDRAQDWYFPVRVLRASDGRMRLLNRDELAARVDPWLRAGGMTREHCERLIFTWNAFRISCEPDRALEILADYSLPAGPLREGAAHPQENTLAPGVLRRQPRADDGFTFTVEAAIDPQAVLRAEERQATALAELMPQNTPEARQVAADLRVVSASGTVTTTFETDAAGRAIRQTTVTRIEVRRGDGTTEQRVSTRMLERRVLGTDV